MSRRAHSLRRTCCSARPATAASARRRDSASRLAGLARCSSYPLEPRRYSCCTWWTRRIEASMCSASGEQPMIDVVIPTYNAAELVLRCVERLSGEGAVSRIVVVDDASADGTVPALKSRFPSVEVIALDRHRGLAHAFNRGSAVGDSELVL